MMTDTDSVNTIQDSLGKLSTRLPETLWNMLRAHCPIRTIERGLFKDAKPYTVPATAFARTVGRALRACFALLKFTDHIRVVYVKGSTAKVDAYFDKNKGMLNMNCR